MKNNLELNLIQSLQNEKICDTQQRIQILKQLKGFKYWLFLLGL